MDINIVREFAESLIKEYCPKYSFQFSNAKNTHGYCSYRKKVIAVSLPYIKVATQDQIFNTITHEIAHAIAGHSAGHSYQWQSIHKSLGGNGKRCSEVSVTEGAKYIQSCVNGCWEQPKFRKPRVDMSRYHCRKCKGKIELREVDNSSQSAMIESW